MKTYSWSLEKSISITPKRFSHTINMEVVIKPSYHYHLQEYT